jgi:hypothetical protein
MARESILRGHWVAVPKAMRARRVNRITAEELQRATESGLLQQLAVGEAQARVEAEAQAAEGVRAVAARLRERGGEAGTALGAELELGLGSQGVQGLAPGRLLREGVLEALLDGSLGRVAQQEEEEAPVITAGRTELR